MGADGATVLPDQEQASPAILQTHEQFFGMTEPWSPKLTPEVSEQRLSAQMGLVQHFFHQKMQHHPALWPARQNGL